MTTTTRHKQNYVTTEQMRARIAELEDRVEQLSTVLAQQEQRSRESEPDALHLAQTGAERRAGQPEMANRDLRSEMSLHQGAGTELHEQGRNFLAILNHFPEILYVTDPHTYEIIFVNRAFRDMLGTDPEGGRCYEHFQGLSEPCSFCNNETLLKTRMPCAWVHFNNKVNKHFMINDQLIVWPDGREVRFELAIDITKQKQAENEQKKLMAELERSNKELERFAYVASHDLQEPLRMVSSYTQLLERRYADYLDSDAREFIQFAVDGAARMQRLINDLLAFSRISSRPEARQSMDPHQALALAITNLEAAIRETGAVISTGELPRITADLPLIVQLFQNLIGNAIKFRGPLQPRVHISATKNNSFAEFSVQDNGIGVDPQYREKIFQIFQRLHSRIEYPGTGMGLAICKRIVERHGGSMGVDSREGCGAAFTFTLPL